MASFSQRSAAIEARKEELVAGFVAARGRQPTARRRSACASRPH